MQALFLGIQAEPWIRKGKILAPRNVCSREDRSQEEHARQLHTETEAMKKKNRNTAVKGSGFMKDQSR